MSTDPEAAQRETAADDVGDDVTIVRALPVDDATIVRPVPVDDATFVRPAPVSDATVVRPRPRPRSGDRDEREQTTDVTAPRRLAETRRQRRKRQERDAAQTASVSTSASVALPVDDPEAGRRWGSRKQQGLDPDRRIAPVPGTAPWDPELMPERGVRPDAPVVYGPRSEHLGDSVLGADEVHRVLGAAPPARPLAVRERRAALPSLERQARRTRIITLLAGVAVLGVCVAGLWLVATLAFG